MIVQTSFLLIAMFQLFKCATAVWNARNPLIVVDTPAIKQIFPNVVREVTVVIDTPTNPRVEQRKVYYNEGEENSVITYAYCPDPNHGSPSYNVGSLYCNYYETLHGERNLPTEKCNFPLDFEISKKTNEQGRQRECLYNGKTGRRFNFVYWLCRYNERSKRTLRIYEACYQDTEMQMIYGKYTIYAPNLLNDPLLADEQNHPFELDTSHYRDTHTRDILVTSHQLYNRSRKYVPRPILPHEWLPFAPQRKPLVHYMNCAPMDASLISAWETLMMNLKFKLSLMNEPLHVTAGVLDVLLDNQSDEKYLGKIYGKKEIPLPKQFWVMISNENNTHGIVIMMDNEPPRHPGDEYFYDRNYCGLHICDFANLLNAFPPRGQYPMYCCHPTVITRNSDLLGGDDIIRFP